MRPELDDPQVSPPSETSDPAYDKTASPDSSSTASSANNAPRVPDDGEVLAGLRLDHFRIDRKLGAGGMGEVYLATDLALDRLVAVKVLPAGVASGSARDRLIREARAQARVHHANVAHIYFIGEDAGRLYFAMEYITGKTLADRIAEGPLPVEEALAVTRAAVLGLREAQRSGFTHRDVKPSNLMLDSHGVLKVVDFGLAAGGSEGAIDGPVAQTTLAGTPLYMAPEQANGEPIDFRADIYALGATLFHLVSGRPPFQADSVVELLTMHASADRPSLPRGSNPRTAMAAIDPLVARMMAPRPEDRFTSYDELLRALELASMQHTRPAGIWVRGIATFIDLMIVSLLIAIIQLVVSGSDNGDIAMRQYGLGIAAVYCTIAIARFGTTAGKALFELEVVSVANTTQRPSWRQAVRREAALAIAPVSLAAAEFALRMIEAPNWLPKLFDIASVLSIVVLGLLLVHASLRVPGKRPPWDRWAGTMVRYRTTRTRPAAP